MQRGIESWRLEIIVQKIKVLFMLMTLNSNLNLCKYSVSFEIQSWRIFKAVACCSFSFDRLGLNVNHKSWFHYISRHTLSAVNQVPETNELYQLMRFAFHFANFVYMAQSVSSVIQLFLKNGDRLIIFPTEIRLQWKYVEKRIFISLLSFFIFE